MIKIGDNGFLIGLNRCKIPTRHNIFCAELCVRCFFTSDFLQVNVIYLGEGKKVRK